MFARRLGSTNGSTRSRRGSSPAHLEALEARSLLDGLPVVYLMQMDKTANEESEEVARFGVKRTGSLAEPLTVYYTISGSATANEDYIGLSGQIRIPAGKKSASLPVIPIDDFETDNGETVKITITTKAGAAYVINRTDNVSESMTITIADTDAQPEVRLLIPDREASEYGPNNGLFVLKRTGPLELPLTVKIAVTGSANMDSSKGPIDFVPIPTSFTFAPGVDRYEIEIDATNDNALEGDETVRITILDTDNYELDLSNRRNFSNTIRIFDRPLVTMFVIDPVATTEPGDDAAYLFHRSGPLDQELRIKVVITGSAREGQDYEDLPRTIIFAPGASTATVSIVGLATSFTDAYRTINLRLANGLQYNVNPAAYQGEVRLYDDAYSPAL